MQDSSADGEGDRYIRSVSFSPDGVYLATGAEDKLIRVSTFFLKQVIYLYMCFSDMGYSQRKGHTSLERPRAGHLFVGVQSQWSSSSVGLG